ncbi:thioredoxin domain-containing protein [Demequina capsici]|uniref:Thioredoxin domain-containing protein n=1 Tax=Demequina capsici TaxID=3075620 RepID=A0AA96FA40_9MICO|nr:MULTISPECIES: thioredoxin domain-containing protein [unclassified Demequina]WNM24956.1 thioredoxin domain-containing protein [Demequina sp. OYTSA14]WNM27863.1 thioredoxin domain-containing protein [Demequina sp. PMTSA13]
MASSDKAAEARAKAKANMKAQERRTTMMIVSGIVVALVVFGGLVFFIMNQNKGLDQLGDAATGSPAGSLANGAIPVGSSGTAGVTDDNPPVTVDVYYDYMCPYCQAFEQINSSDLDQLRQAGTIQVNYHPIAILDGASNGTKYSTRAANAAATVADADPTHFLDFTVALFANQPSEGSDGLSDDDLAALAVSVGVPADVAKTFADYKFRSWVTSATEQSSVDGVSGTPTVMVNGEALDPNTVNYFTEGTLAAYLTQVAGQ